MALQIQFLPSYRATVFVYLHKESILYCFKGKTVEVNKK